jgi:pyruvate/2-oxoglutarate dehydrogenase complex dihydrolipoamide acyltransferase (E2) component
MPQMGVSVAEGTITAWRKRPGDWVGRDETVVEISTDKVETEVPSPVAGRLGEVLVEEGVTVAVGTLLATVDAGARPGEAHVEESAGESAGESAVGSRQKRQRRQQSAVGSRQKRQRRRQSAVGSRQERQRRRPSLPLFGGLPPNMVSMSVLWLGVGGAGG